MSLVQQLESIMKESGISQERGMARNGLALARVINVNDEEGFNRVQCLPLLHGAHGRQRLRRVFPAPGG